MGLDVRGFNSDDNRLHAASAPALPDQLLTLLSVQLTNSVLSVSES